MNYPISNKDEINFSVKFKKFTGKLLLLQGVLLLPFICRPIFLFGSCLTVEYVMLFLFGGILIVTGIWMIFGSKLPGDQVLTWLFGLSLLVYIELIFRITVNLVGGPVEQRLKLWNEFTYPDKISYKGHPFLHYVGIPGQELRGSKALSSIPVFNSFGFSGEAPSIMKQPDEIRIACIGESTTADGYPQFMENYLRESTKDKISYKFEVYNFAHAGWTTNHSVVNFIINILDTKPDYLVIHHAWNEEKIRGVPDSIFRSDYSHIFKSFDKPFIYDRYLIRISAVYRYFKSSYDQAPSWTDLRASMENELDRSGFGFDDLSELQPFRRNFEVIIALCQKYNIRPVIATIPFSTDSTLPGHFSKAGILQTNEIARNYAISDPSNVLLADLDKELTGKINHIFTDFAHVTDEGRTIKAKFIGDVILTDSLWWKQKLITNSDPSSDSNKLLKYINMIKNDASWLNSVREKAAKRRLTEDEMIRLDAQYMMDLENSAQYQSSDSL